MNKILFFDTSNDGHHYLYNYSVIKGLKESGETLDVFYYSPLYDSLKINQLISIGIEVYSPEKEDKKTKGSLQRIKLFFKMICFARKHKIKHIHLLYLDSLYIPLFILAPFLWGFSITSTLHWFPQKKSKQVILKSYLKSGVVKRLVVHGKFTKEKIKRLINSKREQFNVVSIVYPNLHSKKIDTETYKNLRTKLEDYDSPYLLAFGGLRHDKGIDILLEAFSYVKEKATIIIAGAEDHFSYQDIKKLVDNYQINNKVFLDLRFISDKELTAYFELADIIVLPYRKYFSGQSGPLTEGVTRSKLIIGPNTGEIGYTINNCGLGRTFEVENTTDLASQITQCIKSLKTIENNIKFNQESYQNSLTLDYFVNSYNNFFEITCQ